jgi:phage terminase large subunit-like protein
LTRGLRRRCSTLSLSSVSNLTRDELLKLAIRKKLQQVAKEQHALRLFKPNPGPQEEFMKTPKRLAMLFGGNRTGKSTVGAIKVLRAAMGISPTGKYRNKPRSSWVISPTFEVQRDSAQEKILQYIPSESGGLKVHQVWRDRARGYMDRIEFSIFERGYGTQKSSITFKSADQGRKAFQGASVPMAWFDEEAPMDVFMEVMLRTLDNQGTILGTMTPLEGELYDALTNPEGEFASDPELVVWHMDWNDNPYLSEEEKQRMLQLIPEEEREMRVHGRYVPREGRVVREYVESIHVVDDREPGEGDVKVGGFDFGLRTPSAYIEVFVDKNTGDAYAYREHYKAEATTAQHAQAINAMRKTQRIKADPSLWNRQPDGKSVAESMRSHGVYLIRASKGSGTWASRMDRIRDALRYEHGEKGEFVLRPKLYICRSCSNLRTELNKLRWKASRTGNTSENTVGPDHAIDALGYALEDMTYILGKKGSAKVTITGGYKPRNPRTGY